MFQIVKKKDLNAEVVWMDILAPAVAKKAKAGQFIIFRVDETGERVPLTIADYDRDKGIVTIIFQKVGASTQKLAQKNEGDFILDFVGPLGTPSHFENVKKVAVIGGGVGCAIAYPQAKALHNAGVCVHMIAGFRNKEIVILKEEMEQVSDRFFLATDDGSAGQKGFVTDVLKSLLEQGEQYDLVVAIGPVPMMKFVSLLTKEYNVPTVVSMNPIMVDGTGMCGACRLNVGGEVKFACVDGPEFDGHLVDFDLAMERQKMYKTEEGRAILREQEGDTHHGGCGHCGGDK